MVRDAIVLAAGRGTRMKSLTEEIPKPMLRLAGRPLLEWILIALRDAGIERFVIVTGYLAETVEAHFGNGSTFGVGITYRRQEVRDGTARALLLGRESIDDRPFLLAWGDILTESSNYPRLIDTFVRTGCDGVLAVNRVDDPCRGAAVYVDSDGKIERIVEKPPPGTATTNWNNAGIGVFRSSLFEYAASVPCSPRGEYEIPDAITAMIADGCDLRALPLDGYWSDVGTPEDLRLADQRLQRTTADPPFPR